MGKKRLSSYRKVVGVVASLYYFTESHNPSEVSVLLLADNHCHVVLVRVWRTRARGRPKALARCFPSPKSTSWTLSSKTEQNPKSVGRRKGAIGSQARRNERVNDPRLQQACGAKHSWRARFVEGCARAAFKGAQGLGLQPTNRSSSFGDECGRILICSKTARYEDPGRGSNRCRMRCSLRFRT